MRSTTRGSVSTATIFISTWQVPHSSGSTWAPPDGGARFAPRGWGPSPIRIRKIEAKALVKVLGLEERGIPDLVAALKHSCWSLDLQEKIYEITPDRAVLTVTMCATQLTRLAKDLPVFPCKQVRRGYLESFVEAFNPELQCTCKFCPPDERSGDAWCQWEFTRRSGK